MKRRIIIGTMCFVLLTCFLLFKGDGGSNTNNSTGPIEINDDSDDGDQGQQAAPTMSDVLLLAQQAQTHQAENLIDYTATFVKQEADDDGNLGEATVIQMKVQTKYRNDSNDAPMHVYLKFDGPESVKGREVIWGEDLYEGKMAVHETTILLSWKILWLDPNGMVAMQGQKHPISEIGQKRLVEQLIERGEKDRDNPNVSVKIKKDHTFDGVDAELIQVRRAKPTPSDDDDFSLAEVIIDAQNRLILQYRSFGWPTQDSPADSDKLPLQESYTYKNIRINVGLSATDYDVNNPAYQYP